MNLKSISLFIVILFANLGAHAQISRPAPPYHTPVGDWRTFDDRTGLERSMVRIEQRDGVLYGTVIAITDPADADKACDQCTDDRKGHKAIGLEIIRGLIPDGPIWTGGTVLDPESGGVYRGTIRLSDDGNKLTLRGYIALPWIGRSQTWIRKQP